jgi:hypothetical protein
MFLFDKSNYRSYLRFGMLAVTITVLSLFAMTPFLSLLGYGLDSSDDPYLLSGKNELSVKFIDPPQVISEKKDINIFVSGPVETGVLEMSGPEQIEIPLVQAIDTGRTGQSSFIWNCDPANFSAGTYSLASKVLAKGSSRWVISEVIKVEIMNSGKTVSTGTPNSLAGSPLSDNSLSIKLDRPSSALSSKQIIAATSNFQPSSLSFSISGPKSFVPAISADSVGRYSFDWDTSAYPNGDYLVSINALSGKNVITDSIGVSLENLKIQFIDLPETISGSYIVKTLANMDADLVTFYVAGSGGTKSFEGVYTGNYYYFKWNTLEYPDGDYKIEARAIKDSLSGSVIGNSRIDNATARSSGADGANAGLPVNFAFLDKPDIARGTEIINIEASPEPSRVYFSIEGKQHSKEIPAIKESATLYKLIWNTADFPDDIYKVTAVALKDGLPYSSNITIKVANKDIGTDTDTSGDASVQTSDSGEMSILMTAPDNNRTVSGQVRLEAQTRGPIAKVEFYRVVNNWPVQTGGQASPQKTDQGFIWVAGWNTGKLVNKTYNLKARAYDSEGNSVESKTIVVYLDNNGGITEDLPIADNKLPASKTLSDLAASITKSSSDDSYFRNASSSDEAIAGIKISVQKPENPAITASSAESSVTGPEDQAQTQDNERSSIQPAPSEKNPGNNAGNKFLVIYLAGGILLLIIIGSIYFRLKD